MISFTGLQTNKIAFNIIAKLDKSFSDGVRKGLQQSGIRIAGMSGRANDGLIKQDMNAPKSGRVYNIRIGRGGRILKNIKSHQASAPGESPAVISGKLRNSLYSRVEGSNQLRIGANTPYARILEEGGWTGRRKASYIARRNYLIRPILESRRNIINDISSGINLNIKK